MIVKTSELIGAALDWAVCMSNGLKHEDIYISKGYSISLYRRLRDEDGRLNGRYMTGPDLLFSRMWESAGPIIEREGLYVGPCNCMPGSPASLQMGGTKGWSAQASNTAHAAYGPTPLVAAMRCYVASKLGDEVDIPKELT